jgi:nucleoside-diphosphate-sugar epimerase
MSELSTVVVTGGNGKIGSAILEHLSERGYETVNVARGKQREEVSDAYITTDLLNAGETYGALAKVDADAVIHMGTIPHPYSHSEHVTYESNVMSSMHVLTASQALGVESVCLASSINAIGSEHQRLPVEVDYLPIDEDHPQRPGDIYGIAKHAMETTANGIGRREYTDTTISSLRLPWVATDNELREQVAGTDRSLSGLQNASANTAADVLFSYLHIDDAATLTERAIEAEYDGHEVFWTVAADTTADVESARLAEEFYPEAECRANLDGTESLIDVSKAADLLDWEPTRTWRDQ